MKVKEVSDLSRVADPSLLRWGFDGGKEFQPVGSAVEVQHAKKKEGKNISGATFGTGSLSILVDIFY